MENQQDQLSRLLYLMGRLRDPQTGCPWDLKQTFQTIVPHTLEEVYEVVDTIERGDYKHLKEELGDLLFQVVFYSQLGSEQGLFDFNDVGMTLLHKLIVRHPHVFPDGTLESERDEEAVTDERQIKKTWESIKSSERKKKGEESVFSDVPAGFPALVRATKLQKRAATLGFDWPSIDGVMAKLDEETKELNEALEQSDPQAIEEELGDLMFTTVNLCRHLGVDAETSLRKSTQKFERRFRLVEESVQSSDQTFDTTTLEELEHYWNQAKQR